MIAIHLLLLVQVVMALAVAAGKVMTNPRWGVEKGVRLAQAMATQVGFTVMGLPMQMEVVVAVALEEVSAMVRGVVPAQEVGKVQVITADQMVQAAQSAVGTEVEAMDGGFGRGSGGGSGTSNSSQWDNGYYDTPQEKSYGGNNRTQP
jgi:hypothetical protein